LRGKLRGPSKGAEIDFLKFLVPLYRDFGLKGPSRGTRIDFLELLVPLYRGSGHLENVHEWLRSLL
jgi:hypothetical protein